MLRGGVGRGVDLDLQQGLDCTAADGTLVGLIPQHLRALAASTPPNSLTHSLTLSLSLSLSHTHTREGVHLQRAR